MNASLEYNVVRYDADSTDEDLVKNFAVLGREGWKLASAYHIHHLNTVVYVFSREINS